jgi:cobalt-zinc-cadmium efflux system protein
LSLVAGFILYKAIERFIHPEKVAADSIIWLAGAGIVGNGFSAWLLLKDSRHNLNIRGAFLHMMGDLLTSVLVLISGILLLFKPWYWLDPALSFIITAYILKSSSIE